MNIHNLKPSLRAPLLSVALLSAAVLSYEVLLIRLFSIMQWHHFAYMVISIALLGYGASGTFLVIAVSWIKKLERQLFVVNAVLFGVFSLLSFWMIQNIPFNPLELFWDKHQIYWLLLTYLFLIVPFFCAANCAGLVFFWLKGHINALYAANLFGAGIGAISVIGLLMVLSAQQSLILISSMGFLAAAVSVIELRLPLRIAITIFIAAFIVWFMPAEWFKPRISPYKSLSQYLNVKGASIVEERSGPMGLLTVMENHEIPFRFAPGLSMTAISEPPEQLGIFTDGDGLSVITRFDGCYDKLGFLAQMTSSLPYQILEKPEVLVLCAGGGMDVLQALYHKAKHVDAVELNPEVIDIVQNKYSHFAGNIYSLPQVAIHLKEARSFVTGSQKKYDLIQIALIDSFNTASAGAHSLNESYLYTVEAVSQYFSHLKPDGIIAFTRWIRLPPRDFLKLTATAITAMEEKGIGSPCQHIAAIRGWNTSTLLVKASEFKIEEIQKIRDFASRWSFDLVYYPNMKKEEANQFNILDQDYFHERVQDLMGNERRRFFEQYKFDVQPATDNKPYFFHFFKWKTFRELIALSANQGLPLIEWGLIIVTITLFQASIVSLIFIALPLWIFHRKNDQKIELKQGVFIFSYFFSIGLGFMFIEIAYIQRFILFLNHPLYAVAVVLCAFLVFAGIGSASVKNYPEIRTIMFAATGIIAISFIYIFLLPVIFDFFLFAHHFLKTVIAILIIAPLAFFMGMPFPLGLRLIGDISPAAIPWAWGINCCGSVISSILATLLAMFFGFTFVIFCALALYAVAAITASCNKIGKLTT